MGWRIRPVQTQNGFVLDGAFEGLSWRAEWGPSQRSYIEGHEFRVRVALGAPATFQMMILCRRLMETLESEAFERFTEGNETIIDFDLPEEVRWLPIFPKLVQWPDPDLKLGFSALAPNPKAVALWLEGPLSQAFKEAMSGPLADTIPFVLMTHKGRIYLRMELERPSEEALLTIMGLAKTATLRAKEILTQFGQQDALWDPDPSEEPASW